MIDKLGHVLSVMSDRETSFEKFIFEMLKTYVGSFDIHIHPNGFILYKKVSRDCFLRYADKLEEPVKDLDLLNEDGDDIVFVHAATRFGTGHVLAEMLTDMKMKFPDSFIGSTNRNQSKFIVYQKAGEACHHPS